MEADGAEEQPQGASTSADTGAFTHTPPSSGDIIERRMPLVSGKLDVDG